MLIYIRAGEILAFVGEVVAEGTSLIANFDSLPSR